jgi:molybdenum cofactor biosynthesis enzyme MoaA
MREQPPPDSGINAPSKARDHLILRLIDFMDVGQSNGWRLPGVVLAAKVIETFDREFMLEPELASCPGEVGV